MLAPFRIRRLRPADLDRIMEIEHASFGKDAYDRNLFADLFHKCGELFLVAESGRNICGYMITSTCGSRAEVVSIAVDAPARRKGAATALMEGTLRRLRRRGVQRLGLMVRAGNREARAFYVRHGFVKVRIVPKYYGGRSDGWFMARNLGLSRT